MLLAPWFLAGLLAIGVPLWLHRIAREERIKLQFASSMLLESSEVRDTSKRSLRYWVLLAARIALLIALALAFAQPLFKGKSPAELGGRATLHAIVLDASLSMQYGDRWQRAMDEARRLIDQLKGNDRALLVLASGKKIDLVAGPALARDSGTLRATLDTLKPGVERLDYGLLMSSSKAWLGADNMSAQLHIITDLQQSASPLRFADLEPPVNAHVQLHSVADDRVADNANIASITVQGAHERTLNVTLHGVISAPRELVLTIDDREQARKAIAANTAVNEPIVFPALKLTPGAHRLHLSLQPHDALALDDDYFAVIEHTEPKVLLITRDAASDEAAYFAAAIESQTTVPLSVVQATPRNLASLLANAPLNEYSAVVVADSGILSASDAKKISQYVDAGGAALITLGLQAAHMPVEQITAMKIGRTTDDEQRIALVDDSHPVLRETAGWRAVRFIKHINAQPGNDDRVLITLEDRSPLLIERKSAGHLLLLTAPLDRTWNDLAIHPLFVRFIADAARYLTDQDATAVAHVVGTQLVTGLNAGAGGQIFDPKGARVLALDDSAHANQLIPTQLGIYEVRSNNRKRWLAVNADPRESQLEPMDAANVERWQSLGHNTDQGAPEGTAQKTTSAQSAPQSYGFVILWLLAALLFVELALANYRLSTRRDGSHVGGTAPSDVGAASEVS